MVNKSIEKPVEEKIKNNTMDKLKKAGLSLFLIFLIYNLVLFMLGVSFDMKYGQKSERLAEKMSEIENHRYSYDEMKDYMRFHLFLGDTEIEEVFRDEDLNFFKDKDNTEYLKKYDSVIADYEKILDLEKIVNTDMKTIKTPIPPYQTIYAANRLMGLKILNLFKNGEEEKAISLFSKLHKNKLKHFSEANTFIMKFSFLDLLKKDVVLAKIIKEDYGVSLKLMKLTSKDIDLEKAMNTEIEMTMNLFPTLTGNGSFTKLGLTNIEGHARLNYMLEVSMEYYFYIIDNYKKMDNPHIEEFKPTERTMVEKIIAPYESILLDMSNPGFETYKVDFFDYNESVESLK